MTVSIEDLKKEIQGKGLVSCAKRRFIPDRETLAGEMWKHVSFSIRQMTPEKVRENFDTYFCELVDTEYQLYLEYEKRCVNQGVFQLALESIGRARFPNVQRVVKAALEVIGDPSLEDSTKFLKVAETMRLFHKFVEQSFAQGRMTRAGESSQYHFQKLLELAGYGGEFETQQALNGTVDLLFPSRQMWERDRRRCVLVSIKRSLRERYKQVYEELGITRGITIYLVATETYEEARKDITPSKIKRLNEQNVYLVVRDEIKRKRFAEASNLMGFNTFINEELPRRRLQWQSLI